MKSSKLLNKMNCYRVNTDGYTHFYVWKANKNKNTYGTTIILEDVSESCYFVAICCYET